MKSVEIIPYSIFGDDKKLFCSDKFTTGIYEINILTGEARLIEPVVENQLINTCLYTDCDSNDKSIFFIPHHSNSLAIYDKCDETLRYVDLPIEYQKNLGKFLTGKVCDDKIFLFGYLTNRVIVVDLTTDEIKSVDEIEREFDTYIEAGAGYGVVGVINVGNTLYISSNKINNIFRWNTKTGNIRKIEIEETSGLYSLLKCGESIVSLIDNKKAMMVYSIKNDSYKIIDLSELDNTKIGILINYKQNIYAFPQFGNEIVVYNMDNNAKRRINWDVSSDIWNGTVIGEKAYLVDSSNAVSIFDFNEEKTDKIGLYSTDIKRNMIIPGYCKENSINNLRKLIVGVQLDE